MQPISSPSRRSMPQSGGLSGSSRRGTTPSAAVAVGPLAGLADGHHDTAPIGVLAGDRRLHQGRVGDGERDAAGGARARRAADLDGDEFSGALAVAYDLAGEVDQQRLELSAEI